MCIAEFSLENGRRLVNTLAKRKGQNTVHLLNKIKFINPMFTKPLNTALFMTQESSLLNTTPGELSEIYVLCI